MTARTPDDLFAEAAREDAEADALLLSGETAPVRREGETYREALERILRAEEGYRRHVRTARLLREEARLTRRADRAFAEALALTRLEARLRGHGLGHALGLTPAFPRPSDYAESRLERALVEAGRLPC